MGPDGESDTVGVGESKIAIQVSTALTRQDPEHTPSHLICADGAIHPIPPHGRALVNVLPLEENSTSEGFFVWG